jgi:hypothetical protein
MNNKIAAGMLGLVGLTGFIPLLIASMLTGRDYQLELANLTVELWNK